MSSTQPAAASGAASLTSPTSASGASGGGSHFPFPATAVPLTSDLLLNFTAVKKLHVGGPVNSLDFSAKGDQMLLSTDEPDEAVYLLATGSATQKKQIFCRKFGADLVRFTHHPNAALVVSKNKNWDDSIRYLSLHDNRYLRYFKGHRERVTGISMSPSDDSFLSASADRTVRLWDLRTNLCQGLLTLPNGGNSSAASSSPSNLGARLPPQGRVLVSHDPAGLVFAVAASPNVIKLYDSRSFDSGPFTTFFADINPATANSAAASASAAFPAYFSWSSLKFSPDGTQLLLSTTESCDWISSSGSGATHPGHTNQILLLDSYEGQLKHRFTGHEFNPLQAAGPDAAAASTSAASAAATAASYAALPFEASFSPDGAFVLAGSRSGSVHAWSAESGEALAVWSAPGGGATSGSGGSGSAASSSSSSSPITSVQFCPTKMTFVSTDAQGSVVWWMPPKA